MNADEKRDGRWLPTADQAFGAMLAAIDTAHSSVRLESYIFQDSPLGERFRQALVTARGRGVRVRVLVDALGSLELPDSFWQPLREAGGEFRWFNSFNLRRPSFRDHRKLLVCDETVAFVGGFNIAAEYEGDGVTQGWRDLGLKVTGTLARELATAFDDMFIRAEFRHRQVHRLRKTSAKKVAAAAEGELLLSGPGLGRNPIKRALHADLATARSLQIMAAYFLPSWRIRRCLVRAARRGGKVRLMLSAKSDVMVAQLASHSLYGGLLRAGVEIYEYQPQTLHAKLIIVDGVTYVGSANLDTRSLNINYELLVRLTQPEHAEQAGRIFAEALTHCRRIDRAQWRKARTFWTKLKEHWAYFLLARIDPYLARQQLHALR